MAEIEERWASLRRGTIALTVKQTWAPAGEVYRAFVAEHEENPNKASFALLLLASNQVEPGNALRRSSIISIAHSDFCGNYATL